MPTDTDCEPNCGCKATTAEDALAGALELLGCVKPGQSKQEAATAVSYLLREYGWTITRGTTIVGYTAR